MAMAHIHEILSQFALHSRRRRDRTANCMLQGTMDKWIPTTLRYRDFKSSDLTSWVRQ
ncbi:hypothetical protein PISMIDRAFT_685257 [Pisolithus microcarpus 441]|uniref:Uncharacterized protein n=1 Tax=Pisolithus microcarpus 441 TaxID=765257 RepID=A0A0C9ZC33_9AGAM|nr:hypothetical protein PISMIDRAFT_685257 [Pisolithus microcarpus 441]